MVSEACGRRSWKVSPLHHLDRLYRECHCNLLTMLIRVEVAGRIEVVDVGRVVGVLVVIARGVVLLRRRSSHGTFNFT